jgi:sulfoxide reductase heme-binding subunit YedZ
MSATVARKRERPARPPARRQPIWRDPAGRFSWLKTITLVLVFLPGLDLALAWSAGALGGRPVTEVIHGTGEWAVRFLLMSLAVTPARMVLDWPRVVLLRRLLGVTAACYAAAHLFLYCVDENFHMLTVVSEIVLRFYLTIGFIALCGLLTLAATSTDGAMRRMGRNWKRLHRLVFPVAVLALFHYFMQSKADVSAAVFVTGLYAWELLWRAVPKRLQGRLWLLPLLAIAAGLATAGIEAAWYALATGVDARRVLLANLHIAFGPRPAVSVFLLGLAVFVVAAARRLFSGWRARGARPAGAPAS